MALLQIRPQIQIPWTILVQQGGSTIGFLIQNRTLSLTHVRFTPKREIFLHFCPHFAISAKDMMLNDFKVTLNGSIIGPHISRLRIINGFDPWLHFPYLGFKPLFPPGCRFQPVVHRGFSTSPVPYFHPVFWLVFPIMCPMYLRYILAHFRGQNQLWRITMRFYKSLVTMKSYDRHHSMNITLSTLGHQDW